MMEKVKTQSTGGVWPHALHHHLANINGQWRVNIGRLDSNSFTIFAHVSLIHMMFFSIIYFLCYDGKVVFSAHTLSLATRSNRSLVNINGQQQVCFEDELSLSSPFLLMFFNEYSLFCHGNGENSAHRLSLATRSYHCLAMAAVDIFRG